LRCLLPTFTQRKFLDSPADKFSLSWRENFASREKSLASNNLTCSEHASGHRKNVLCTPYVSAKRTIILVKLLGKNTRRWKELFVKIQPKFGRNSSGHAHCFRPLLNYAAEVSASWEHCSNILTLISYDTVPTTSPSTSATKYPKRGHIKNLQAKINNHKMKRKIRTCR
jgi:hypothetical protein